MGTVYPRQGLGVNEIFGDTREEVLRIANRHGAGNVRVFGSVARGAETDESDIDLLVDVIGPTTSWFPASLKLELEALMGNLLPPREQLEKEIAGEFTRDDNSP